MLESVEIALVEPGDLFWIFIACLGLAAGEMDRTVVSRRRRHPETEAPCTPPSRGIAGKLRAIRRRGGP
jgi:hypothetical protein